MTHWEVLRRFGEAYAVVTVELIGRVLVGLSAVLVPLALALFRLQLGYVAAHRIQGVQACEIIPIFSDAAGRRRIYR